ncbi:hypothetical protein C8Q74DRAFT_1233019 [Fomes fomentarius]|nr:hypothetical protein C8Q74DRAFT_1233019 [Fomes fomentarius]
MLLVRLDSGLVCARRKELSSKEEHGVVMVPMHAIVDSKSSVTYPRPIKAVGTTEKVLTVRFEMFKLSVRELAQYVSI